jgi:hypothetical protein
MTNSQYFGVSPRRYIVKVKIEDSLGEVSQKNGINLLDGINKQYLPVANLMLTEDSS